MPALHIGLDNPLQPETQALHASLWLKHKEREQKPNPQQTH